MKNLNNKEFEINKTTMRDLTHRELNQVAGASHCPSHFIGTGNGQLPPITSEEPQLV
jgi:hypothetical protein